MGGDEATARKIAAEPIRSLSPMHGRSDRSPGLKATEDPTSFPPSELA